MSRAVNSQRSDGNKPLRSIHDENRDETFKSSLRAAAALTAQDSSIRSKYRYIAGARARPCRQAETFAKFLTSDRPGLLSTMRGMVRDKMNGDRSTAALQNCVGRIDIRGDQHRRDHGQKRDRKPRRKRQSFQRAQAILNLHAEVCPLSILTSH